MLVSFGSNLLVSQPEPDLAREAFAALDFHVHADFFMTPTAACADIVLPVATSWEREGLRTGFDASLEGLRRVQLRPAVIAPVGDARSDTDIVMALSERLGLASQMFGLSVDAGHDAVLAPAGLSVSGLRSEPAGVELATSVRLEAHAAVEDGKVRGFPTPSGLMELYSETLQSIGQPALPRMLAGDLPDADPQLPLLLGNAKTIAYCHSQHRNIAALRRLMPDPVLEMAEADAQARGIRHGDWVEVRTVAGTAKARAAILADLAPGTVFGQHGWWAEPHADAPPMAPLGASINGVMAVDERDPVSGSLPLRATPCDVARCGANG